MTIRLDSSASLADGVGVLGATVIGDTPAPQSCGLPVQHLLAPLLGSAEGVRREYWLTDEPTRAGHTDGIAWRRTDDVLYGVIELDEDGAAADLRTRTRHTYGRVFALLAEQRLPHLWRVWNYMADILGRPDGGAERYREFNLGRAESFAASGRSVTGQVPAASALGSAGGPLSIAFLAGATPALAIENPRQVSAYHYPAQYGPRSPTFSRGALVYPAAQEILFVSGTASIVGHRSLHDGDVAAQCREAMDNVAAVLAEANRHARGGAFGWDDLALRVYVRHAADLATVQQQLASRLDASTPVFVQAVVCRHELLVEIEAMGMRAR